MRRIPNGWKVLSTASAFALLAGAAACGGDDEPTPDAGGGGMDATTEADAGMADAGDVDAGPSITELRSGTIAISEVALTNPGLTFKGAAVNVTYADLTTATVAPAYGQPTAALGDCSVYVYDVGTDSEPTLVDEGDVTITGGESPIGTCVFSADANGYVCPFAQGAVPEAATVVPQTGQNSDLAQIVWPTDDFTDKDVAGMFVVLDGFTNPENNGKFPIVNKPLDNILLIFNPQAVSETVAAGSNVTYSVFAGAGPTPADREFLTDTSEIVVQKADGTVVAQLDSTVVASGEGLTLDDASAQPHEFPTDDTQDITYSCDGTNGVCGPSPEGSVSGFVLSGRTTDADITGLVPTDMPAPQNQYAVFQCRGVIGENSLTVPQAALTEILGTNPNRVEVRLLRITADLSNVEDFATSVVVGHGFVGYTDTNLNGN